MIKPKHSYLQFHIESITYDDLDAAIKHIRKSSNPLVQVYYCGNKKTLIIEQPFMTMFADIYKQMSKV